MAGRLAQLVLVAHRAMIERAVEHFGRVDQVISDNNIHVDQ